jgi:hypothetical protein
VSEVVTAMPFMKVDQDSYDEMAAELGLDESKLGPRPTGEFEYESASAAFDRRKLGAAAGAMLDALVAAGATEFRVRYDGGYDEGFSHADSVHFGARIVPADRALGDLASPALSARVRAAVAAAPKQRWGDQVGAYAELSDADVARNALDELAYELASKLLGDGFGTGEYQLYGVMTADLTSGQITDDPEAQRPASME